MAGRLPLVTATVSPLALTPVPAGRARWRFQLFSRSFATNQKWNTLALADLSTARSRQLQQNLNTAATLIFTLDGRDPAAVQAVELATDVVAWRWDEVTGADAPMFRGVITQSEDQLSEQAHTINFTCWDYFKMFDRRALVSTVAYSQWDQDNIAADLISRAGHVSANDGHNFGAGAFLPITFALTNPDGSKRTVVSGQLRDRTYLGNQALGAAVDDLAHVINGFDYDVLPWGWHPGDNALLVSNYDSLRLWYPSRGITRTDTALVYGLNVANVTRTVNSADYGNYWRVLGNNGSSDPAAAQLAAEAYNADASNGSAGAVGLWMSGDNAADVTIPGTLADQANGDLIWNGTLVPSYSLGMRPGAYLLGQPNIGDVVPLYIRSGRLNVQTSVRVVGITYDVGDDGQEDVTLIVGRPPVTYAQALATPVHDINALVRR